MMMHATECNTGFAGRLTTMTAAVVLLLTGSALAQPDSFESTRISNGGTQPALSNGNFNPPSSEPVPGGNAAPTFFSAGSNPDNMKWDPSFTVAGVGGFTYAVYANGDTLYLGGRFSTAGNLVTNNVAKYDVTTKRWLPFDTSSADRGVNGGVYAFVANGDNIYIGGNFTSAGGVSANNVVRYNTVTGAWSPLGTGVSNGTNGMVWTMLMISGNLYVGGWFTRAGGDSVNYIARWDGSSWHSLGSGVDGAVEALAERNSTLYVGGRFKVAGGDSAYAAAQWDGSSWSPIGTTAAHLDGNVYAMLVTDNAIYVGGNFTNAGSTVVNHIAKWDGQNWNAVGNGTNGSYVQGFVLIHSTLYVMGAFTMTGILTVNNVAAVDTSTNSWSALGSGSDVGVPTTSGVAVWASTSIGDTLYVSGSFQSAGGRSASGVASWDGAAWSPLAGVSNAPYGTVSALAGSGENIYVGGNFTRVGGIAASNIAVYNRMTGSWSALGSGSDNGVDGTVYAVAVSGSNVYVAGSFAHAGSVPAKSIAMWDGATWNTLGTSPNDGVNGYVRALALYGTDLYVGGSFTTAGGSAANYAAKWTGAAWSPLGTGLNGQVYAIAAANSQIYFGGPFTRAGGDTVNHVASWNGVSWSALGTSARGVDAAVQALAADGDTVFAGGEFSAAGGSPASGIARWNTHDWTPVGSGVNGPVYALALLDTSLVVGGSFTASGVIDYSNVAEWSIPGQSFTALGDGVNGTPYALLPVGTDTYVGGAFAIAGGKPSYDFAHYRPGGFTSVEDQPSFAHSFQLYQNYPNPFNPVTTIGYRLPSKSHVLLKVYDILGREVATLVNRNEQAGAYTVRFDASKFASGVYFYRLTAGESSKVRKLLLLR